MAVSGGPCAHPGGGGVSRHNKRKRRKTTAPQVPPRPPRREDRFEDRPQAPWHPFPLVEICVLIGLVCIVLGFLRRDDAGGRTILALGFALGALGGLDTAAREHFAGYRSHTLVLSAFPAVATAVVAAIAGAPRALVPALLVVVFALAFGALRRVWDRTARRTPA
jgi:hypothetical protein